MPLGDRRWTADELDRDRRSWRLDADPRDPEDAARQVRTALADGPGFVHLRGFPVEEDAQSAIRCYEALVATLGPLLPQNVKGDRLHLVQAQDGRDADRAHGSRGSGELLPHTDQAAAPPPKRPRLLGLLALDQAARGGETRLLSGEAILARVSRVLPGARLALLTPIAFGRDPDGVSDDPVVFAPVVERRPDGRPGFRYNRYFNVVGAQRSGQAPPAPVAEALDAFDEALSEADLMYELLLAPGEAIIVDNLAVLHNRAAYTDDDVHRRCLVRAWMA